MNIHIASALLAQSPISEQGGDFWTKTFPAMLDRLGFPVVLIIMASWGLIVVVKWVAPKIDAWIASGLEQKKAMTEQYKKTTELLAESSKESTRLQQENLNTLKAIQAGLLEVCKHRCVAGDPSMCSIRSKD